MSIERAADLMAVLLDATVPAGFTGGPVARIANRLTGFEDALRVVPVMHHDETPSRVAGDNNDRLLYVYTARAGKLVWLGAAGNRGHDALDAFKLCPGIGERWKGKALSSTCPRSIVSVRTAYAPRAWAVA